MKALRPVAVCLASLSLAGCATFSPRGADVTPGARPPAKAISALGGGLIGGAIGQNLAREDRRKALEAEYRALEYTQGGRAVTWTSDGGQERGEVVAAQPYRVGSQDCRQYVHTIYTGAASQTARGSACRNNDGSWTLLS